MVRLVGRGDPPPDQHYLLTSLAAGKKKLIVKVELQVGYVFMCG